VALTKKTYSEQGILNQCYDATTGGLKIAGTINGNLTITGNLTVSGDFTFGDATTDILTVTGKIRNADGTAALPSYSFTSDPNSGFYWVADGDLRWACNGVLAVEFSSAGIYANTIGTVGAITLTLKGAIADGASAVGATIGSANTLSTAGAKLVSFVNNVTEKAYVDKDGTIYGAGSLIAGGACYTTNGGFFANAAVSATLRGAIADGASAVGVALDNSVALTTAGSKLVSFRNATVEKAYIDKDGSIFSTSGYFRSSAAVPVIFIGNAADGASAIANKFANATALTTAGAKIASFYSDAVSTERAAIGLTGEFMAGAGTALLPSHSFLGDPDTGFYSGGANLINFAVNGAVTAQIASGIIYSPAFLSLGSTVVLVKGQVADGASAVGVALDNSISLTTAGSKLVSFRNATVEKAYIDKDGFYGHPTDGAKTASTTQTQGFGAITTEIVNVSVCANANDTVTLPTAKAGIYCYIFNNGAQTLRIFPASGDNLGAGVDTATTLAAAKQSLFIAYDATNWQKVTGANLL